ncbi:prenyl transferase, putative [Theileria annulata]|uniref:Prenyl transferase, putative n=1 Tax=Theileria annulata TaxID=5874 RepID=Q4UCJ6_THEAN|nr:prenyl transferase, putative [Theileria annulata]CAI75455.1 prenyl transferase, putative [Theileria annulata]|eukprot:XP_954931.1 prenyl transferase, putative [Theileria annulata]
MFKYIIKRNVTNVVLSQINRNLVNQPYNGNNVLNAIKLTLPIMEMDNETVENELRSLERDLSKCKSDHSSELFIKESLFDFKKKIMDSIYTNNIKFDEAKNYILNTNCKLFRPIISFYIYHILNSSMNNSKLSNPAEEDSKLNISTDDEQKKLVEKLNISYELVHIGSLIHDDIIDESDVRRNLMSSHKKFGVKFSVLFGDFLLSKSAQIITSLQNIKLVDKLSNTLDNLIHGELMYVNLNNNDLYLSYLYKIYLKTASLISNNISSISHFTNKYTPRYDSQLGIGIFTFSVTTLYNELLYIIGVHIGLSFQMCDDLLDYNSNLEHLGKPILNDIKLGLITLPLIYLLNNGSYFSPEGKTVTTDSVSSVLSELKSLLNKYENDREKLEINNIKEFLKVVNDKNNINKCKLSIYYHLYQVKSLMKSFNQTKTDSLINYIYNVVNRYCTCHFSNILSIVKYIYKAKLLKN